VSLIASQVTPSFSKIGQIRSVLIVRGAFADIYEPTWCRALTSLGVRCEVFDAHKYTLPGLLGRFERRVLWGPGIRRLRKNLLKKVTDSRPDVTLLYQGHYFDSETIHALRELTFVAGYHNDDPFGPRSEMLRYRLLLSALPHYDGFHVYRPCNVVDARLRGAKHVGLLMPYYIPWLDYPRALSREDQQEWGSDVVFAGHVEDDLRIDCLGQAIKAQYLVRIFGEDKYWKRALATEAYESVRPIHVVFGDDYRKALCASKIAACFFSKWNRDVYTRRSFEIPACGAFLLSERTAEMMTMFKEGEEAEYFSSAEEFLDKVRFYIANDSARERIARRGLERVRTSQHDILSRMRHWCRDVFEWMGSSETTHDATV